MRSQLPDEKAIRSGTTLETDLLALVEEDDYPNDAQ